MTAQLEKTLRISLLCLLVLWGGYTFLQYLGVPVHLAVLLSDANQQAIQDACGNDTTCTQWRAIVPVIGNTITRINASFLWYIILSLVVYGVLLVVSYMKTNRWRMHFTMTPLKLILAFIGFLWLLFTVLSNTSTNSQPYRRVYMPSAAVYPSADPQTLEILAKDYNQLKEAGCLTEVQNASQGVEVSNVRQVCMQTSFITRVMTAVFSVLYLLLVTLSIGRMILQWLKVPAKSLPVDALFSVGIGACGLIVVLWSFAVAGLYTQLAGWLILLALPLIAWKQTLHWLKALTRIRWEYDAPWHGGVLLLTWLLLSYLLFNFLTVVRPFPIGWDDLGVYLNGPRQLVTYGHFIPRLSAFQWEYITSLGFLLFGYDSWFGATISMMMNWTAGLLAVCTVYVFGSHYFGRRQGVLSALLYYTLPMVGHFSFADMKVDNAVFTMGALCMLAVFLALFPAADDHTEEGEKPVFRWQWIILGGIFGGFGFAMKPTVIMVVLTMFSVIAGVLLTAGAFVGAGFLAWAVFTYKVLNVPDLFQRIGLDPKLISSNALAGVCLVIGAAVTGVFAYLHPKNVKHAFLVCAVFLGVTGASVAPWILHNNILAGNIIPSLILGAPNNVTPSFFLDGRAVPEDSINRTLPADLKVDPENAACKGSTSKSEELDRYWGYGTGISHYLGLPWRTVMNLDSAGYYVTTMPALLLFPLLLLLPFFWSRKGRWLRWLFIATLFLILQWMFFANGVIWYGIGMFLGLSIGLEALVSKAPDRSTKITASVILFLSFVIVFANRFWQFENQKNLYAYSFGLVSGEAMQERTIPHYNLIRDVVLQRAAQMPDSPYVYRIGTFIPYFIPRNMEILPVADNQLDLFTCMNQDKNAQLTVQRLKALGFNSIIFDTNTQTIEKDPNGTLHKKVSGFLNFVNTPELGLQVVVNDLEGGIVFLLLP